MPSLPRFLAVVSLLSGFLAGHAARAQGAPLREQKAQLERLYALVKERYVYPDKLYPEKVRVGLDLERFFPPLQGALEVRRLSDWDEVRAYFSGKLERATSAREADAALEGMFAWLSDDHSVYLPPARAAQVRARFGGSIPCLTYAGQSGSSLSRALQTRLEGRVGVVTLPDILGFDRTAQMRSSLLGLRARGARAFVIDLRGNPGGQLLDMAGLAGLFSGGVLWRLSLHGLIFPIPIPALGGGEFGEPLAFVVDAQVNSAAEGLSGGLQFTGRARVFGETSAGNVEAVYPYCLPGGAVAFLASGQLAPWGGPSWEGKGVVPDGEGGLEAAVRWAAGQVR